MKKKKLSLLIISLILSACSLQSVDTTEKVESSSLEIESEARLENKSKIIPESFSSLDQIDFKVQRKKMSSVDFMASDFFKAHLSKSEMWGNETGEIFQTQVGNVLGIIQRNVTNGAHHRTYEKVFYYDIDTGENLKLESLISDSNEEKFYTDIIQIIPRAVGIDFTENREKLYDSILFYPSHNGIVFVHNWGENEYRSFFVEWDFIVEYIDKKSTFYELLFEKSTPE